MTDLFHRVASLEVHRADGTVVTVDGARIAFEVARDDAQHANKATVRVWNLSTTTRSRCALPATVTLTAGYRDTAGVLFRGSLWSVSTDRQGADTVLVLSATDGAAGRVAVSRSRSTPWLAVANAVVDAAVASTGVREGNARAALAQATAPAYSKGFSCAGPAMAELQRVLAVAGLRCSVQGGELLVLGGPVLGVGQVVSLDAASGLLGSPVLAERTAPGAKATRGHLMRAFLQPRVAPGSRVSVTSTSLTGQFLVRKVSHSGDLEGASWISEIEVIP